MITMILNILGDVLMAFVVFVITAFLCVVGAALYFTHKHIMKD